MNESDSDIVRDIENNKSSTKIVKCDKIVTIDLVSGDAPAKKEPIIIR